MIIPCNIPIWQKKSEFWQVGKIMSKLPWYISQSIFKPIWGAFLPMLMLGCCQSLTFTSHHCSRPVGFRNIFSQGSNDSCEVSTTTLEHVDFTCATAGASRFPFISWKRCEQQEKVPSEKQKGHWTIHWGNKLQSQKSCATKKVCVFGIAHLADSSLSSFLSKFFQAKILTRSVKGYNNCRCFMATLSWKSPGDTRKVNLWKD